jgi:hypothetical protein
MDFVEQASIGELLWINAHSKLKEMIDFAN